MAETLTVGMKDTLSFVVLDQRGQKMSLAGFDATPSWSNDSSAVETVEAAGDGMTAEQTALGVGTDTIHVTVVVAGTTLTGSLAVTVDAQTPTTVQIVSGPVA